MSSHIETIKVITQFLRSIGLRCDEGDIPQETLLPGIFIDRGGITYDSELLLYPGDLLHEAGHIATSPPSMRAKMEGNLESTGGDEMAAIAWSFAAGTHLRLDPDIIFHDFGYKGGASSVLESFKTEQPIGVPLLAWYAMTDTVQTGGKNGPTTFPKMRHWLRETEPPPEPEEQANSRKFG